MSECGTLSLFDDIEEKDERVNKEKDIFISKPSSENQIQTEIPKKPEDEISNSPTLPEISGFEKHEQITSTQIEIIDDTQETE